MRRHFLKCLTLAVMSLTLYQRQLFYCVNCSFLVKKFSILLDLTRVAYNMPDIASTKANDKFTSLTKLCDSISQASYSHRVILFLFDHAKTAYTFTLATHKN